MELDTHAFIDEHDIFFGNSWEDKALMAQPEEAFIFDDLNFVEQSEQIYVPPEPQVQPANNVLFCNDMSQLHAIQNTFSMNSVPFIIVNVADQQQQYQQQQMIPSPVILQGYAFGSPCPSPYVQSPSPYTPIDEFAGMSLSAMSPGYPTSPQPQYRYNGKRRESFNDAEDLVKRMKLDQQFGTRFKGTSADSTPTIKEEDIELNDAELSSPAVTADNDVMFVGEVKNRMRRSRTISGISGKTSENNLKRQRVQKMKRSQTLNSINNEGAPSPAPLHSPAPSPATPMTPSGEDWAGTRTEFRYLVSMGHKRRKNKKAAPEDAFMSRFSLKY